MIGRVILTVLSLIGYGIARFFVVTNAPIIAANLAAKQFDNSNVAYNVSQTAGWFTGSGGWVFLGLLVTMGFIWWKPARTAILAMLIATSMLAMHPTKAGAYYSKYDYAEPYVILPNESAFWIPDVGNNKSSQVKFGSEAYFQENKVAAKRFVIPHTKLENSGMWSDYYVPAGRLIVVDRTPYNREWTQSEKRGTAKLDQAIPCQSSEGLNITTEVGVAASVHEDDAAKFLYFFGVNNLTCDRTNPECVFTSVMYGKSLEQVMDGVGRGLVQTAVCNEIEKHTLAQDDTMASQIMETVRKTATAFLATRGITLDYIGWAGTFTFDHDVQDAINKAYIASVVSSGIPVLQSLATVEVKEGLGSGLAGHGLPSNWLLMPENLDFTKLFTGGK